jgi:hypothetical protein
MVYKQAWSNKNYRYVWDVSLVSSLSLVCRPPIHLSLSLSHGLPKGYAGARQHHRCSPSCCVVSRSRPKLSTSAISAGSGIPGVIVINVCVWLCRGADRCSTRVIAPSSLTTLRSPTSASSTSLVWEHQSLIRSSMVCLQTPVYRYNITST